MRKRVKSPPNLIIPGGFLVSNDATSSAVVATLLLHLTVYVVLFTTSPIRFATSLSYTITLPLPTINLLI